MRPKMDVNERAAIDPEHSGEAVSFREDFRLGSPRDGDAVRTLVSLAAASAALLGCMACLGAHLALGIPGALGAALVMALVAIATGARATLGLRAGERRLRSTSSSPAKMDRIA